MNSQKNKGDRAEREAAELLSELLPWPVRRRLGAGRNDDEGDLEGVPDCALQVADWQDKSGACLIKPREGELQRRNAKAKYAASIIRWRGGHYRAVLTLEQFAKLLTAAIDD